MPRITWGIFMQKIIGLFRKIKMKHGSRALFLLIQATSCI